MFVVNKGFELANQEYLESGWDMVQRNIAKISSLALDLLTYSKERKPQYRPGLPHELASEVVELLKPRAFEFGVDLVLETPADLGPVAMDVRGMHQCLVNLVNNAIDACRPEVCGHRHGRVTLRVCPRSEGAVCFEVEDNGCGIDEQEREKLFTTLFSTKGAEGTGLGLLNVQKVVGEHHGIVELHSEPGRGSVFRVVLPRGAQALQERGDGPDKGISESTGAQMADMRR
jgi:signal transduction histidine kinase